MVKKFNPIKVIESDDNTEHSREFAPTKELQKKNKYRDKSYKELYEDALNGNEDALTYWAFLYTHHKETVDVINELNEKLDKIIESNSDPKRLNACFMRSFLHLEVSKFSTPIPLRMNELLDEIIKSDNSAHVFIKNKAMFYRAQHYSLGIGCEKNFRMALKYYLLSCTRASDASLVLLLVKEVKKSILDEDFEKIKNNLDSFSKEMQMHYFADKPIVELKDKEKTKLKSEMSGFMEQAQKIYKANHDSCLLESSPLPAEDFFEVTCKKISVLAAETFSHRHKVRRILADVFFIPLGFATLGVALVTKKLLTGSFTFYGAKTTREDMLDTELIKPPRPK